MPKEDNKILKYNNGEKSMKAPFIIFSDMESLLNKIYTCLNNLKKSSATKKINILLLAIHCLLNVHLMYQKINIIIIEAKIV